MESGLYQEMEEVLVYEGVLISYMTDPESQSTVESRLRLFRQFARKKELANAKGKQPKPYYAELKAQYGTSKRTVT